MNEKLQLTFFVGAFLAIYASINYFVLYNLAVMLDISRGFWFYIVLILLTSSFIVASILESAYGSKATKAIYAISGFWLGYVFMMFWLLILFRIMDMFLSMQYHTSGIVLIILGFAISIIGLVNSRLIAVDEVDIQTGKVKHEVRIVQISDLHAGPINGKNYMRNVVYRTNKLEPDYVFMTGDLLDGRYKYNKDDFSVLKSLKGKKFFVTGNHETYAGIDYSMHILDGLGFHILRDESVIDGNLQILGIDDAEDKNQVHKVMRKFRLEKDKYRILLYHRPVGFRDVQHKIDLMLSGHTHAGQIFPFTILAWLDNKYVNGLYEENGAKLFVTSGTGTWGPPIRIGSRNEIVLVRLIPSK